MGKRGSYAKGPFPIADAIALDVAAIKPGPKPGPRVEPLKHYVQIARDELSAGTYANVEQAAYQIAKKYHREAGVPFEYLRSSLRNHLRVDCEVEIRSDL